MVEILLFRRAPQNIILMTRFVLNCDKKLKNEKKKVKPPETE